LGIDLGQLPPGRFNHPVDVAGVSVGHVTLGPETGAGPGVRTGVTAVLPHTDNWFRHPVPAAVAVINGYGTTTGTAEVAELGRLESPVLRPIPSPSRPSPRALYAT